MLNYKLYILIFLEANPAIRSYLFSQPFQSLKL